MIFIFWIALALVVAGINLLREDEPRSRRRTLEVLLQWWLVVCLGVSGLVGGAFHVFDQTSIARQIGFTQGDGSFHFEVGMANWAIGAICVMCFWFRDRFWLARWWPRRSSWSATGTATSTSSWSIATTLPTTAAWCSTATSSSPRWPWCSMPCWSEPEDRGLVP
jgi:hypothetical protein